MQKKLGATSVDDDKEKPFFKGAGYALGTSLDTPSIPIQTQKREVIVTFWNNGFQVDDEPLRSFQDPNNEQFLDDVIMGLIPRELQRFVKGSQLSMKLVKQNQDYVPS